MSTRKASRWLRLLVLPAALIACSNSPAATRNWDGGGSDAFWTSAANWSNDLAVASGDALTFGTAAAVRLNNTNDFASGTSFSGITFANSFGFTLNGNDILLGSTGIDHTSGVGVNTVNLAGITLTATQDWYTPVNGLQTIASPINLNGFNLSLNTYGGGTSMTLSGPISGSGNVTKTLNGNGQLILSGTNSYTGDTIAEDTGAFTSGTIRILGTTNTTIGNFIVKVGVANGKLEFQSAGSLGGLASNVIKLNPTGGTSSEAQFMNLSVATLVNNVELGGRAFIGNPSFALTLNGTFTLTGNGWINPGAGGGLTINSGITESGGSRSLTIGNDNRIVNLNGNNSYSGGTFVGSSSVAGSSSLIVNFNGDNSAATGDVLLRAGQIRVGNSLALGTSRLIINPNATALSASIGTVGATSVTLPNQMVWSNNFTIATTAGNLTLTGDTIMSNNVLISFNGGNSPHFANKITDDGGGRSITLTVPSQIIRFSGVGSTYSGGLRFESSNVGSPGTLELGSDDALGSGLFRLTAAGGAGHKITAVGGSRVFGNAISLESAGILRSSGDITFNGPATLTGNRTIWVAPGGTLNLAGGVVEDAAGRTLTQADYGTLILGGNGNYSGATTISFGTVIAAGNNALGTAAAGTTVANAATLGFQSNINYSTAEAVTSVTGTGTNGLGAIRNFSGNNTFAGPITLTGNTAFGADSGSLTLSGAISGAFALTKAGPGTVALDGALGYTGNTTISNGALRVTANLANLPAATIVQLRGGVLESSGTFGKTLGAAAGNFNWNTGGGGFSAFAGPLTVDVNGNSTADNLIWGSTANFVPAASPLIFGSVTANNTVTFTDNINLGASGTNVREIRVNKNTNSTTDKAVIAGAISGTSGNSLLKSSSGVLEFQSANTYAGNTTISGGTLLVNNTTGSGTGSGSVTVNSGATLGGTGTISGAVTVDAGGGLAPGNSPGTLTVSALTLTNASVLSYELGPHDPSGIGYVGLGSNDLTIVNGNLTLDGILNVTALTGFYDFGAGAAATNVYRLFTYSGGLTDNALTIGSMPAGTTGFIQTSIAGQVNLLVIPEPSTIALIALSSLIAMRRLRRNWS